MNIEQHRLGILSKHITRWLEMPGMTQTTIAIEIVEQFRRLGLNRSLQVEDIFFMDTGDVVTDANTNRQKIFRWLGWLDNGDKRSPARLFFVEQAIVSAMPEAIRMAYLTEIYMGAGVSIYPTQQGEEVCMGALAATLIKEGAEAQVALLSLRDDPRRRNETLRELNESLAAHNNAITTIERMG